MKKSILSVLLIGILSSSLIAGSSSFFLSASVGGSVTKLDQDDKRDKLVLENDSDDEDGIIYNVGAGYGYKGFIIKAKYSQIVLENAKVNNALFGIGYQFKNSVLKPYIGILAGQSELKWDKSVVQKDEDNDLTSKKPLIGAELQAQYDFCNCFSFLLTYSYYGVEHNTNVVAPSYDTDLKHKNFQNLLVGLRYEF